jgi:uncharacterized membrane protein
MRVWVFKGFLLLAGLVILCTLIINSKSRPACTLLHSASILNISLVGLARGDVRAYCYEDPAGQELRFLLARDSNGNIHTAFDACRRCYKYHDGYTWSHGYLICRWCGTRYRIKNMNVGKASCAPVPLASKVHRNDVTIKVKDVEAGKWLF